MKKIILCLVLSALVLSGCGNSYTTTSSTDDEAEKIQQETPAPQEPVFNAPSEEDITDTVEITMQNGDVITVGLMRKYAPETVENFLKFAGEGFYDGLTFHRIIEGFMIQGGDPQGTGMGGSDETIKGEFYYNGVTENTLAHKRGVISMARSNDPNSASSQFFIMHADAPHLDGSYAAFGMVTSGMEAVDKIATTATGANDMPAEPVIIDSIKIVEKTAE